MNHSRALLPRQIVLLTAVFLLLTACFGGGNNDTPAEDTTADPATPLTGNVVLRCNQTCLDRGQCGTLGNGDRVVLGGSTGPTVDNHDLLFPHDTAAIVQASTTGVVEPLINPTPSQQTFYLIALEDNSKAGWVAGWCVRPR